VRGSIEVGKQADLVVLDGGLEVRRVFRAGREIVVRSAPERGRIE
jgi:N-acetylglucosamine-6-phosphate deacetylase